MKRWIAFWRILVQDMRTYYLKPPNISWGILFPLAWTGMFFVRSGKGPESLAALLPGVITISILFGTTSMLAVTITFEKRSRTFERLLLAPVSLELLMLAKTAGAILFGVANAFVPVLIAASLTDLSAVAWSLVIPAVLFMAVATTFLGLFVAVSVNEIFEAQTLSNFFRFPMIFLCGMFFPVTAIPVYLRPISYMLPVTYGVDILQGAITGTHIMPLIIDFFILGAFCVAMFVVSLNNVKHRWIVN